MEYPDALEGLTVLDGLDSAIVGIVESHTLPSRVCYDYNKCVEIFKAQGMTEEEAIEWMDFNVLCLYTGESTPAFLYKLEDM